MDFKMPAIEIFLQIVGTDSQNGPILIARPCIHRYSIMSLFQLRNISNSRK